MKSLFARSFISLLISALIFAPISHAADSVNVTATVTVQNIVIELFGTDGAIAYGTITTSSTKDTTTAGVNDTEVVKNTGNVNEDFAIQGQDSTAWELADTAGSEAYTHKWCITTCDSSPSWDAFSETGYEEFATGIAANGTQGIDLQVGTPTSTATYTQQSVDVSIQASAS